MTEFLLIQSTNLETKYTEAMRQLHTTPQKVGKNGWPETKNDYPHKIKPFIDVHDQLSVEDGITFKEINDIPQA